MFKSLKEKLKGWVSKNEEDEIEEVVETVEKPKKEKKVKKSKDSKKIENKKSTKEKEDKPSKEERAEEKKKAKEIAKTEKEKAKEEKKKEREAKKKEKEDLKKKDKEDLVEIVKDTEEIVEEIEEKIEEVIEDAEEIVEDKKPKSSIFKKILTKEKFNDMFEELEMILVTNNVAYDAVDKIKKSLEEKLIGKSLKEVNLANELKTSIEDLLINPPNFIETIKESIKEKSPYVILFSGINGAGKTTTIAKVTALLQKNKLSVCLAAADTFRAAAIQQLEVHANKLKVPIIKKDYGTDPAAVAFDGVAYAKKHKIDVVLIDTAGRLHTQKNLMEETAHFEKQF